MERISIKTLEILVTRLNKITNSPETPWTRDSNGKMHANIGNFHLSQAYGGVCVHRMHSEGGGITTPISHGHIPKREAYNQLHSFINGLEFSS